MKVEYNFSNKKKIASKPKLNFLESLYLPAIINGMLITLSHLFKKKATISYPEQSKTFSNIYRGLHVLKRDEAGAERCTACGLCALACPAEAITIEAEERKSNEKHLYREEKYASKYEINMLRCIFCGLCEQACPKEAIFLTDNIVKAKNMRENFIFGKDKLLESIEKPIDISKRQTSEVLEFKKDTNFKHNKIHS